MQLNPQQEQVANHVHGRIVTLAGPGSGKTRTLTERTGRLIRKSFDPASILCLTFTNKARDEMRQRIAAIHGKAAEKVFIANFHGRRGMEPTKPQARRMAFLANEWRENLGGMEDLEVLAAQRKLADSDVRVIKSYV